MTEPDRTQSTLEDIDARQDEILERLEALNRRVEHLLCDWRPEKPASAPAPFGESHGLSAQSPLSAERPAKAA